MTYFLKRGLLLSLEGIDFTWKTPFTEWLQRDCSQKTKIVITRDPPYKLSPWDSLKEFFEKGENMSYLSEAMMLLSARIDNCDRWIIPAISKRKLVIADRYIDSWFAYQSIRLANYFHKNSKEALEFLLEINQKMVQKGFIVMPNLTILISDDPKITIQRKGTEKVKSKYDKLPIQQLVHEQYQILSRMFPERILVVDVNGKNIYEAYEIIKTIVLVWFEKENKNEDLFPLISKVKIGQRIMALRQLSWTIEKFEDYPLVVTSGDQGIIKKIGNNSNPWIQVEWDKDEFKKIAKSVNLGSQERFSCIILN